MWMQKISTSVKMVETVIFDYISPHSVTVTLNLFAWHPGLWWCITIPSVITQGSALKEILFRWTFTGILDRFHNPDPDDNRVIQSFHKKIQLMMMCHQTKFKCKRISSSEDNPSLWPWTWRQQTQSFWKTIWLKMMHHHTKFGSKMFGNSEDII